MRIGTHYRIHQDNVISTNRDEPEVSRKCQITMIALSLILIMGVIFTLMFLKRAEENNPPLPTNCTNPSNC